MIRSSIGIGALALLAAGCAPTMASDMPEGATMAGKCDASGVQNYIGQRATAELGGIIKAETGSEIFQWVGPDTMVTMDYRENRVRVSYDEAQVIQSIRCG